MDAHFQGRASPSTFWLHNRSRQDEISWRRDPRKDPVVRRRLRRASRPETITAYRSEGRSANLRLTDVVPRLKTWRNACQYRFGIQVWRQFFPEEGFSGGRSRLPAGLRRQLVGERPSKAVLSRFWGELCQMEVPGAQGSVISVRRPYVSPFGGGAGTTPSPGREVNLIRPSTTGWPRKGSRER